MSSCSNPRPSVISLNPRDSLPAFSFLAGILGVAAFVRLWDGNRSLWLDELHTAWVVGGGLAELPRRAAIGNQSPLYFYLPWAATKLLGASELALRLPSLLAGLLVLALAVGVARAWTRSIVAALLVGWLLAVDHNCVFYSQEARPYAWLQLVGLGHVYVFWVLAGGRSRAGLGETRLPADLAWRASSAAPRLSFIATGVILFWIHYTAVMLLAAECVWFAIIKRRGDTASSGSYGYRHLACDLLLIVLGCLPAGPHLAEIAGRRQNWAMFVPQQSPLAAVGWFALVPYVLIPATAWLIGRWRNTARRTAGFHPPPALIALLACWFLVPTLAAWLATTTDLSRLFLPRYLVTVAVAPMFVASLFVAACPAARVRLLVAALVGLSGLAASGMPGQFLRDGGLLADRNQDWRSAVRFLNEVDDADLPVLVRSGLIEADRLRRSDDRLLREYCLAPLTSLYRLQPGRQLVPLPTTDSGKLDQAAAEAVVGHRGAWLVFNGTSPSKQQFITQLRETIARQRRVTELTRERDFGQVTVWRVAVELRVES